MSIFDDAGHGGSDPGSSANNFLEKNLTLQISLYQEKRFQEHGLKVLMTREDDSTVELADRMVAARKSGAKVCISNHINAGGGTGAEVWRSKDFDTGFGERIIEEFKKIGWNIHGQGVKKRLSNIYPGYDYYAMNNTHPVEGIIVEFGFIDSEDIFRIINRLQELNEAVIKATVEYLGIEYVSIQEGDIIIEQWQKELGIEATNQLSEKGLITKPEQWLNKIEENTPNWLFYHMINLLNSKIDNLKIVSK